VSLKRIVNHHLFAKRFFVIARQELENKRVAVPDKILLSIPPLDLPKYSFKIRKIFGTKIILDLQDAWPETFYRWIPGNQDFKKRIGRILFAGYKNKSKDAIAHADAITAVANTYLDVYGADKYSVPKHIAHLGTRLEYQDKQGGPADIPILPLTFAYVGSMSKNYDLETVIYAASICRSRGANFRIKFAGSGPKSEHLIQIAEEEKLADIIRFYGFLPFAEVVSLLANSHVALNPILPESYIAVPNKIGDYLAANLPIINSIRGELEAMLKENDAGEYYIARSASSLAEAMMGYISNPQKATAQGKNARRLAESAFDQNRIYPEMVRFIEAL